MDERRVHAARRALDEAREGLSSSDPRRTAAALERLVALSADSSIPVLTMLYGQGLFTAGLAWMLSNDDEAAVVHFRGACDACILLGSGPEAMELAIAASYLFEYIDQIRATRRQNRFSPEPDGIFNALIRHVLDRAESDGDARSTHSGNRLDATSLLERLRAVNSSTSDALRFVLAAFAFSAGEEATSQQRSGEAQEYLVQAARLLEGVQTASDRLMVLAEYVYPSLAFERQRHGDRDGMHASLNRYDHFLRKHDVDVAWRNQQMATQRAFFDLQLAVWKGAMDDAKRFAQVLLQVATPAYVARHGAFLNAILAGGNTRTVRDSLPVGFDAVGPAHGLAMLGELAAREWTDTKVAKLIQLSLSGDPQAAWRAAALLGGNFDISGDQQTAILFGKLSTRVLQGMRLELAQRGSAQLDSFGDDIATRATQLLAKQLVDAGRLGEALCVANLVDVERSNVPVPRVADIAALADAACTLSASERRALKTLAECTAGGEGSRTSLRAALARIERDLRNGMPPSVHIDDGDFPVTPGVARLAVIEADNCVRATLCGVFGAQSETVMIRPADLNTLVFDALRTLSSPRLLDAMPLCRALYDLLIAPFRALLDRHRIRVLIVRASGVLRRIPASVLHDGASFLAEHYAIVAHPGVATLRKRAALNRPVRALSVVVSDAVGMEALPAARLDAKLLRRVVEESGVGAVDVLEGVEVGAAKFEGALAARPTVWHMSSHFKADQADASRSAFVLADGSSYPLARLAQQDLSSVELALMMGCETRSVSEVDGEMGISAVDALLLRMGVGTVVGTAWSVDDAMAHTFLKALLEGVLNSRYDLAEAARRSLVTVGRDPESGRWRHPHEWGGFVLSGAWSGLE